MKIIAWSGPRNLSTAMMYSFGARSDCAVSDEPFYAAYLAETGLDHPMRAQIIASQPSSADTVAGICAGPAPGDKAHWYQKHMCHHMLDAFPLEWARDAKHIFLIRHPARVIASYARKREMPTLADLGYARQADLFAQFGGLVLDSVAIRAAPEETLRRTCEALGLTFDPSMLQWQSGGHPDDGVWAEHWYDAVHASTGFGDPEGPLPELSGDHAALYEDAMAYYRPLLSEADLFQS